MFGIVHVRIYGMCYIDAIWLGIVQSVSFQPQECVMFELFRNISELATAADSFFDAAWYGVKRTSPETSVEESQPTKKIRLSIEQRAVAALPRVKKAVALRVLDNTTDKQLFLVIAECIGHRITIRSFDAIENVMQQLTRNQEYFPLFYDVFGGRFSFREVAFLGHVCAAHDNPEEVLELARVLTNWNLKQIHSLAKRLGDKTNLFIQLAKLYNSPEEHADVLCEIVSSTRDASFCIRLQQKLSLASPKQVIDYVNILQHDEVKVEEFLQLVQSEGLSRKDYRKTARAVAIAPYPEGLIRLGALLNKPIKQIVSVAKYQAKAQEQAGYLNEVIENTGIKSEQLPESVAASGSAAEFISVYTSKYTHELDEIVQICQLCKRIGVSFEVLWQRFGADFGSAQELLDCVSEVAEPTSIKAVMEVFPNIQWRTVIRRAKLLKTNSHSLSEVVSLYKGERKYIDTLLSELSNTSDAYYFKQVVPFIGKGTPRRINQLLNAAGKNKWNLVDCLNLTKKKAQAQLKVAEALGRASSGYYFVGLFKAIQPTNQDPEFVNQLLNTAGENAPHLEGCLALTQKNAQAQLEMAKAVENSTGAFHFKDIYLLVAPLSDDPEFVNQLLNAAGENKFYLKDCMEVTKKNSQAQLAMAKALGNTTSAFYFKNIFLSVAPLSDDPEFTNTLIKAKGGHVGGLDELCQALIITFPGLTKEDLLTTINWCYQGSSVYIPQFIKLCETIRNNEHELLVNDLEFTREIYPFLNSCIHRTTLSSLDFLSKDKEAFLSLAKAYEKADNKNEFFEFLDELSPLIPEIIRNNPKIINYLLSATSNSKEKLISLYPFFSGMDDTQIMKFAETLSELNDIDWFFTIANELCAQDIPFHGQAVIDTCMGLVLTRNQKRKLRKEKPKSKEALSRVVYSFFHPDETQEGEAKVLPTVSLDERQYYNRKQALWQAYFNEAVDNLSNAFSTKLDNISFISCHRYLSSWRGGVAKDMQHEDARLFGLIPGESARSIEHFVRTNEGWSVWEHQAPMICESLKELMEREESEENVTIRTDERTLEQAKSSYPEHDIVKVAHISMPLPSNVDIPFDGKKASHVARSIANIINPYTEGLDHVIEQMQKRDISGGGGNYTLYLDSNDDIVAVKLDYPGNFLMSRIADYYVAESLFEALKNWNDEDGVEEFKLRAGRLAKFCAQKLFIARGSVSVAEVMIYAMAKSKGIDLGEMQLENGLSWCWKALVTPSIDDYAQWFSDKLFSNAKIVSENREELSTPITNP
jgi:F0F1-type ATP synthase delta subunit